MKGFSISIITALFCAVASRGIEIAQFSLISDSNALFRSEGLTEGDGYFFEESADLLEFTPIWNSIFSAESDSEYQSVRFQAGPAHFFRMRSTVMFDMVEDYSIDLTNSITAIETALADAKQHLAANPLDMVELYFPSGEYEFPKGAGGEGEIFINSFTNGQLVVRGDGPDETTFCFETDPGVGFSFDVRNSRNVSINNLHLTLSEPATSQGTVLSVGSGLIDFEIPEGFPDPVELFSQVDTSRYEFAVFEFTGSDSAPTMAPDARKIRLSGMQHVSNRTYRATMQEPAQETGLVNGDRIAIKSKNDGGGSIRFLNCENVILCHLKYTGIAGNPVVLRNVSGVSVHNILVDRADAINGIVPHLSTPYGGIQLMGANGVTIEDCVIIGTADDGIGHFVAQNSNVVVRNCIFQDNHSRGIYMNGVVNGLYENNTLIRSLGPSILICAHEDAVQAQNLNIQNNTIIQPWGSPTFHVRKGINRVRDVTFRGNRLLEGSKNNSVLQVEYADNAVLKETEIFSFSSEEDHVASSEALVYVEDASSVYGGSNSYRGTLSRSLLDQRSSSATVDVQWVQSDVLHVQSCEDAFIDSKNPDRNTGTAGFMKTDNQEARQWMGLVKFDVSGISDPQQIASVKLRLMPSNISLPLDTPMLYACDDNSWSETSVTWNTRPGVGALLGSNDCNFIAGNLTEFDVTDTVTANGTFSFYLHSKGGVPNSQIATKENGMFMAPELAIELAP